MINDKHVAAIRTNGECSIHSSHRGSVSTCRSRRDGLVCPSIVVDLGHEQVRRRIRSDGIIAIDIDVRSCSADDISGRIYSRCSIGIASRFGCGSGVRHSHGIIVGPVDRDRESSGVLGNGGIRTGVRSRRSGRTSRGIDQGPGINRCPILSWRKPQGVGSRCVEIPGHRVVRRTGHIDLGLATAVPCEIAGILVQLIPVSLSGAHTILEFDDIGEHRVGIPAAVRAAVRPANEELVGTGFLDLNLVFDRWQEVTIVGNRDRSASTGCCRVGQDLKKLSRSRSRQITRAGVFCGNDSPFGNALSSSASEVLRISRDDSIDIDEHLRPVRDRVTESVRSNISGVENIGSRFVHGVNVTSIGTDRKVTVDSHKSRSIGTGRVARYRRRSPTVSAGPDHVDIRRRIRSHGIIGIDVAIRDREVEGSEDGGIEINPTHVVEKTDPGDTRQGSCASRKVRKREGGETCADIWQSRRLGDSNLIPVVCSRDAEAPGIDGLPCRIQRNHRDSIAGLPRDIDLSEEDPGGISVVHHRGESKVGLLGIRPPRRDTESAQGIVRRSGRALVQCPKEGALGTSRRIGRYRTCQIRISHPVDDDSRERLSQVLQGIVYARTDQPICRERSISGDDLRIGDDIARSTGSRHGIGISACFRCTVRVVVGIRRIIGTLDCDGESCSVGQGDFRRGSRSDSRNKGRISSRAAV